MNRILKEEFKEVIMDVIITCPKMRDPRSIVWQ